jgi:acyl carrier protein phosphodiesterase
MDPHQDIVILLLFSSIWGTATGHWQPQVLTAAQIHQRFRLFAEAMPASKAAAEARRVVIFCR